VSAWTERVYFDTAEYSYSKFPHNTVTKTQTNIQGNRRTSNSQGSNRLRRSVHVRAKQSISSLGGIPAHSKIRQQSNKLSIPTVRAGAGWDRFQTRVPATRLTSRKSISWQETTVLRSMVLAYTSLKIQSIFVKSETPGLNQRNQPNCTCFLAPSSLRSSLKRNYGLFHYVHQFPIIQRQPVIIKRNNQRLKTDANFVTEANEHHDHSKSLPSDPT